MKMYNEDKEVKEIELSAEQVKVITEKDNQEYEISPSDLEKIYNLIKKEGNAYHFIHASTQYECFLRRSPTTGAWCGYVMLPIDHPFHDLSYDDVEGMDDVEINVHGGLTYSERGLFGFDCSHSWDYYPMQNWGLLGEFVTGMANIFEHMQRNNDPNITYKTKEYAIKEVNNLAEQFYEYRNKKCQ